MKSLENSVHSQLMIATFQQHFVCFCRGKNLLGGFIPSPRGIDGRNQDHALLNGLQPLPQMDPSGATENVGIAVFRWLCDGMRMHPDIF